MDPSPTGPETAHFGKMLLAVESGHKDGPTPKTLFMFCLWQRELRSSANLKTCLFKDPVSHLELQAFQAQPLPKW